MIIMIKKINWRHIFRHLTEMKGKRNSTVENESHNEICVTKLNYAVEVFQGFMAAL